MYLYIIPRGAAYLYEGYGIKLTVCVHVCVCVCVCQRLQCDGKKQLLLDIDLWISQLKLLSRVMASLLTVKAVAVSSKSFIASFVRTNFLFNFNELVIHCS